MQPPKRFLDQYFGVTAALVALFLPFLASNVSAACVSPPSGLVSWWRGEANALDQAGTNHGTAAGGVTYGSSRVGQGFVFEGNGAVVQLGNPASLHFQDLTIETWIRRASASVTSLNGNGNGAIFGYNLGGYGIYLDPSGTPTLSKIGFNEVKPGVMITDTNLHHLAVTKVGSAVVFYVDGVAYPAAAYDPGFTFSDNAFIGGLGNNYTFYGTVDEVSVYNRALATNEIQAIYNAGSAGKCVSVPPPACAPAPMGLVSWWRGEVNASDQAGTNNGTVGGNTTYGAGRVGQAFVFDGNRDAVSLGNPARLQLQDFTIETWIKRASTTVASFDFNGGIIFGYGFGGYNLAMFDNGTPFLGRVGVDFVAANTSITDTNLHHLAVTKVGTNVIFYVDGAPYLVPSYGTTFTFDTAVGIGGPGDNSGNSFFGTIDELSIYDRALSATEIQAIYGAGGEGKCVGTPPPTCTPAPSGLLSWWRGETNALDQTGTNPGALAGSVTFAAGMVGKAFSFDGTGEVIVSSAPSLNVQSVTFEAWVNPSVVDNGVDVILNKENEPALSASDISFELGIRGPVNTGVGSIPVGHFAFFLGGIVGLPDEYGGGWVDGGAAVPTNQWSHCALTFNGTAVRAYVNGTLTRTISGLSGTINSTTGPFKIGSRSASQVSSDPTVRFNGLIDEVSVYNRSLAGAEVQAVYNAGSAGKCVTVPPPPCAPAPTGLVSWWRGESNAQDQTGTNHATLTGNTTYGAGRVGQGFMFDGNHDAVSLGNPVSLQLQDFTIETWIQRASATVASFDVYGGELFAYGGGGYALGILDNGTPYLTRVDVDNVMPNTAITDTNLHHLAVTKLGTNVVFYVDGVAYAVPPYITTYNFATPAAIGARGETLGNSFFGTIDELSIYNRQLSAAEIQAIYAAGGNGKCLSGGGAPFITAQPVTQTVTIGESATFNVTALGTAPLSYQWRLNSTNIAGATADTLVLTNVQPALAGAYSVTVSNTLGSATSSNATLTVNTLAGCVNPPAGLVSWWRGEANTLDQVSGNNGTLAGNPTYGAGRVSQAFVFDGMGDGVSLGNPASLQLQDFTIETWIKRASTTVASFDFYGGELFAYGNGGYALGILDDGTPFLTRVGIDNVMPNTAITDTNLHHLAVTKVGTNVVFYVDGLAYLVPPYNTTYTFASSVGIGFRGDTLANSFFGTIDELSVYNRSLFASEIQALYNAGGAGKCLVPIPAFVVTQPANKTVLVGGNTTFSVTPGGTPPFSYQWRFNGASITNATNATLNLANVQGSQAGNYAVEVGNAASPVPVLSSNATLTVTYPPANVRVFGTNIVSGRLVTLPIRIAANGNENAVSFSLNYTTARLNFSSAQLGNFPPGTYFFVNTSQTNGGRLGVTVALPDGATFAPGTQLLAGVTFDAAIWLSVAPTTTTVSFGDVPMVRGLTDVNLLTLAATYTSGTVTLSGTDLEGDAYPRPGGSRSFTLNDWLQAGRFAAKLDLPTAGGEFQRADCAPRGTQGDGQINVMDWVQAGRYFAILDPLMAVGGPTNEVAPTGPLGPDALREVRVAGTNAIQGVAVTLPVTLQAQGNENGVGFTVSFDPAAFNYLTASLGNGAAGANFNLNTNQVASGKLGMVLVLPTGSSFAAGAREIARVSMLPTAVGSYPLTLTDQLVLRGVSDPAAIELAAGYVAGTVVVNPHPTLLITRVGTNVALLWPALASGFNLQSSTNAAVPGGWGDVLDTPQAEGDNLKVLLPVTDQTKYFRLRHP